MIALDLRNGVERLGDMIAEASIIVPFTGAGISTECGIPDFRSPGGLWTSNRPIPFDEFVASRDARDEAWRRRFAMEPTFAAARPGRGHRALAALYKSGKIPAIITQNIDNLHQMSGFAAEHVVELHGNTTYARCIGCGRAYDLAWVNRSFETIGGAPDCTACDDVPFHKLSIAPKAKTFPVRGSVWTLMEQMLVSRTSRTPGGLVTTSTNGSAA